MTALAVQPNTLAILERAFTRVHRSLTQYVAESGAVYDVGEVEIRSMIARQKEDILRLGRYLMEQAGRIAPSNYPIEVGELNYLNVSYLLEDWIKQQKELLAGLAEDRAALFDATDGVAIFDEIVQHERENLAVLEQLHAASVKHD